jgi:hypothetical protein
MIHVRCVTMATMRLRVLELGNVHVLAGAAHGAVVLSRLVAQVHRTAVPTTIALDFAGVTVATSSFLRECVLGFRDYCRRSQPDLHPVVANLNETVLEELRDLLKDRRQALVCCALDGGGAIVDARVEGVLEEKQIVTLDAVLASGEADAASLADRFTSTDKIGLTGWNNRLASLAAEGILIEARVGRAKKYRPVVEDLRRGP